MAEINQSIYKFMSEYLQAKTEPFKSHPLASFMRNTIPKRFSALEFIQKGPYVVNASVGQGNWAAVPWIAIMNENITTSTQRGYYIVYLFNEQMNTVYLTFAQGVTETEKDEIKNIKDKFREFLPKDSKIHTDDNIYLGDSKRAKEYAFSTAAYIKYDYDQLPEEDVLIKDLKEMVEIYENFVDMYENELDKEEFPILEEILEDKEMYEATDDQLINHIYEYITASGFLYSKEEVTNLYLSLKTKPFVIISGISGTGKTRIARLFAESLGATEENGQYAMIPVRPDWNDGSDLLGYVDIRGDFKEGPLTTILRQAIANPDKPYFVLLDEMNLARVEYYFSDILSVMESREWIDGDIVSSNLLSKDIAGKDIYIPENLYVIGTVNMDETTHPFSKKVLDRANTIEFNDVHLNNFSFLKDVKKVELVKSHQRNLSPLYLHIEDLFDSQEELVRKVSEELSVINKSLEKTHAHIGYRVRNEICYYLAYSEELEGFSRSEAFDYCILQKILPRISGSDSRVDELLKELYVHFTNKAYDETINDRSTDLETAKYPQSAKKVLEMLRRLEEDGFTSFWIT